jgi:adenylate cyclase
VLGPRYLVEPSMRSAGGHLRIQVLLVDASNGEQLWAQHHDHEGVDVLKVQDEIAAAVVGALAPALLQPEGYACAAATCVGARRSETLRGSLRHRRIDSNYNQTPEELGTEAKCRLAA